MIPAAVLALKSLKNLNLCDNRLRSLPLEGAWPHFSDLFSLLLAHNKLQSLPIYLGKSTQLTFLDVTSNPIVNIPQFILSMGSSALLTYLREKSAEEQELKKIGQLDQRVLESMMKDDDGYEAFRSFLGSEHAEENVLFWKEVELLKEVPLHKIKDIEEHATRILQTYVNFESPREINIPSRIQETIKRQFDSSIDDQSTFDYSIYQNIFNEAQHNIMVTLRRDSLIRFEHSTFYEEFLKLKKEEASSLEKIQNSVISCNRSVSPLKSFLKKEKKNRQKHKKEKSHSSLTTYTSTQTLYPFTIDTELESPVTHDPTTMISSSPSSTPTSTSSPQAGGGQQESDSGKEERKWLVEKSTGPSNRTLLHLAASDGALAAVQYLLGHFQFRLNQRDALAFTPLLLASREGHVEVVQLLLKNGACGGVLTTEGNSVLHLLAKSPLLQTSRNLSQMQSVKSDGVNIRPNGMATQEILQETLALLLQQNQRISTRLLNLQNSLGNTPLHEAACTQNFIFVGALFSLPSAIHIDLSIQNGKGQTALEIAQGVLCEKIESEIIKFSGQQARPALDQK
eukprot:TRINITY_DN895_c0_g1_i1.p1 TRINITY_DN895_c0_g1~~TRINITY_DN895_c0_g1_i1.p1  ORF type:complete len:568 (-),score=141.51 TRINITY_DN895_c0_g1_i1:194-1897(-)